MNSKQKYLKYKQKYYQLKNRMVGGAVNIVHINDTSFLSEWKKIPDSGQFNCGIYVKQNDKNVILKCINTRPNIDLLNTVALLNIDYEIFPTIHKVLESPSNSFIEMHKFDGDLTHILLDIIPNICANTFIASGWPYDIVHDFIKIFNLMVPSTKYSNKINSILKSIITHEQTTDLARLLCDSKNNDIIYNGITYKYLKIHDIIRHISTIEKISSLSTSRVTFENYNVFVNELQKYFKQYLSYFRDQYCMVQLQLTFKHYYYSDNKFDNFAYTLHDKPSKIDEVSFYDHIINKQYFQLHIIDWDSGLFPTDVSTYANIEKSYNEYLLGFSINGQYNLRNFGSSLCDKQVIDSLFNNNLTEDIKRILTSDFTLDTKLFKPTTYSMTEIINEIEKKYRI
jgi:hypothetical protein